VRIPKLDQAKVHQHDLSIGTDNDVRGLDIAMDNPLAVTISQSIEKLLGNCENLILG
jgi:hypothetical protein